MAEQRTAQVVTAREIGPHTRMLRLAIDTPLGLLGGQYVIVHTGISIADGRVAKRAYSILTGNEDQHHFELAVRRIGTGCGSNFMYQLDVGSELSFTGPWGKFRPEAGPESGLATPTALIMSTDTGITAAVGLLNSSIFRPYTNQADLYWLLESEEYFLPENLVRARVDGLCRRFIVRRAPPAGSAERPLWMKAFLDEVTNEYSTIAQPKSAFLSGDGSLIFPMRERLASIGFSEVRVETFFNHQERKSVPRTVST